MKPEKPFPKFPYECPHPLDRRDYKPDQYSPKLITCLDCGAILFMQVGAQKLTPARVPLAATLFGGDHGHSS